MTHAFLMNHPDPIDFVSRGYLRIRVKPQVRRLIDEIIELARPFFRQDEPSKVLGSLPGIYEGWQSFGGEFSITRERPDLHESFWVTRGRAHEAAKRYECGTARELHRKMLEYLEVIQQIEAGILADLASWLGGEPEAAALGACSMESDLQVLYYQPARQTRDLLQDQHEDSLSLTFAWSDSPGLELLGKDGCFRPAGLEADELAVLPGEILALMSGFDIRPQVHRVVRHPDQAERMTLSYFSAPDVEHGAEIEPWIQRSGDEFVSIAERISSNRSKYLV